MLAAVLVALADGAPVPQARELRPRLAPEVLRPDEAAARLRARELKRRPVAERLRPVLRLPTLPAPQAVGCGSPCTDGTLRADNSFFDVLVDCATGEIGIRTGDSHPATVAAGAKQDVLFDAAEADAARGGRTVVYVHEDAVLLDPATGRMACAFDPADTPEEPNSLGIEQEWQVSPRAGLDLLVRHELVSFGSTAVDSGVRSTLEVTNLSAGESATVGVRWWLDAAIGLDDGPTVTTLECDPPAALAEWITEHEFPPPEIAEFLHLTNDDVFGAEPTIEVTLATAPLAEFAGTFTPDRLVTARWSNAPGSPPWDYSVSEGDPTDDDVILMLYRGSDAADAATVGPGESTAETVVLLSDCDRMGTGPSCVTPVFTALADPVPACPGATVTLSADVVSPGVGDYTYTWTFGDGSTPLQVSDPTLAVEHVYEAPDFYGARLTAHDGGDPGCSSFGQVDVDVVLGPAPVGELTDELRVGRAGPDVVLTWAGSPVTPPSFAAFRTGDPLAAASVATFVLEVLVAATTQDTATDTLAVGAGLLFYYKVFPADTACQFPILPPDVVELVEILRDDAEADSGWTVDPEGTDEALTGAWVRGDPNGTAYQVEDDHTEDPGVNAWVTGNQPGAADGDDDVDAGCTTLQSPVFDLTGRTRVQLSYWRSWNIGAAQDDVFLVEVSNDGGGAWTELETIATSTGGFVEARFDLDGVLGEPPAMVVLRFTACDTGQGSIVEAAVDDVAFFERR